MTVHLFAYVCDLRLCTYVCIGSMTTVVAVRIVVVTSPESCRVCMAITHA